uniref:HMG box domain-containing protein n=1 Tax=Globodera pallida TaxID=36090 RepID=A0A183BXG5_GLOPA
MSISAESSTAGDITADQEYLCPTFSNLDPSEELRFLHDRIAQLELQQSINLPTSSASFDLLAQNENDVADTFHGQNDEIEPTNDKESTADQQEEEQKKAYGTRLYKSPECLLGQPYTPKTDISDSTEASDDLDLNKFVAETAQQWQQMTNDEKRPYVDQAQCNIAAYHKEMAEWKQKYANEIKAWKEANKPKAKAALKARDAQFNQAPFEWNINDDREVDEKERIQLMLLDDSTHLVEKREWSSDDDRDIEEEAAIQRMFLAISTYLGRKEISQNQRVEY